MSALLLKTDGQLRATR